MGDEIIRADIFGQILEEDIRNAERGDAESAMKILSQFCNAIKENTDKDGESYRKPSGLGTQIDERILRYLGKCFQKILKDGPGYRIDANHALGLIGHKRGNKKKKASRNLQLDMAYQVMQRQAEIKAQGKMRLKWGDAPLDTAIAQVAKEVNKSVYTVRNAYKIGKKAGLGSFPKNTFKEID